MQDKKFCQYTEILNQKHGIRRKYTQEARDILINLNESDKAASFMNDTHICINKNTDLEFNECFVTKCNNYANMLNNEKKPKFLKKLQDKNIL